MTANKLTCTAAEAIRSQIILAKSSRRRQVNVEFEGVDPGHDMSQDREIRSLTAQLRDGGWFYSYFADLLWDREQAVAAREEWNGAVKAWMAANPGKKIANTEVANLQKQVSFSLGDLKSAVEFFALK